MKTNRARSLILAGVALLTIALASCRTPEDPVASSAAVKASVPATTIEASISSATVNALVGKECGDYMHDFDAGAARAYALVESKISAPIAELIRDRCQTQSPAVRFEDGVKLDGCTRHDCADNRFDLLVSPSTGVSGLLMQDGRCEPINMTVDEAVSLFRGPLAVRSVVCGA